jgi:hypothetical protein
LVTAVWAQKDASAIVGLVRDSSDAVVAGARVTVIDVTVTGQRPQLETETGNGRNFL